ncbi:serine/threonine-protein kinase [Archangium gephyra]|uniref:non-specific serine/threonine protein kinase n=1 Tax=Archangium gephyra TaxID=48 RepID=A0AAC8TAZ2_9BACT|nr:serine/threonine-protein kinase [Archangium gephyra]AKI99414.1 Serine/threonine protein kinase PrkC, regulator of stationary phase [Archangium gephyra]REG28039.1 serine/threonine-protein kinase [Archangium gephyra]
MSTASGNLALPARFGRYVLLNHLGRGGMADIFRGVALGAGGFAKQVVVKRVLPEATQQEAAVQMFIEEARLSALLQHMNIAQIFDFGEQRGEYFIAMEFIHGRDLYDLMKRVSARGQGIPVHLACYIAMEVLKGLDYAHRARSAAGEPLHLVHRDVNPTNIILSFEGEVKLLDFGVALVGSSGGDIATNVRGKPGYIPPEQLARKKPDGRGDIFALGITLYEMLSRRHAFKPGAVMDVLKQTVALKARPLRLQDAAPFLPEPLCTVVNRCILANPDERYQSAADVLDALDEFLLSAGLRVSQRDLAALMASYYEPEVRAPPVQPPIPPALLAQEPAPTQPAAPTYAVREPGGGLSLTKLGEDDVRLLFASGKLSPQAQVSQSGGPFLPPSAFPGLSATAAAAQERLEARLAKAKPPRFAGNVGSVAPLRVLARLMLAKATGRLHFEQNRAHKELFLKAGQIIAVRSSLATDRFGPFLLQTGKLSVEQWQRAVEHTRPFSGRLLDALLAARVLSPSELAEWTREHRRTVALSLLGWTGGRYAFFEGEAPITDGTEERLGGLALLNEGLRAHYPLERLVREQESLRHKPLHRNPDPPVAASDLALSATELRASSLLNKPGNTLTAALAELKRPEDEVALRRVALLFTEVGLLAA